MTLLIGACLSLIGRPDERWTDHELRDLRERAEATNFAKVYVVDMWHEGPFEFRVK